MGLLELLKRVLHARILASEEQRFAERRVESPDLRSPKQKAANATFEVEIAKREAELHQQAQPQPG